MHTNIHMRINTHTHTHTDCTHTHTTQHTQVLTLKAMGINDLLGFDFMDPPPAATLVRASTCSHTHTCVQARACAHTHTLTHMYLNKHTHIHANTPAHKHIDIHTHTHTHTLRGDSAGAAVQFECLGRGGHALTCTQMSPHTHIHPS